MLRHLFLVLTLCAPLAASEQAPGVYVILDGSGSMWGQLPDGSHKITAAREVLRSFAAEDYAGRDLAFRVYGHRRKGDCADSELVVPFAEAETAISRMARFAENVNPTGKTPISRSLRAALEDFGQRPGEIILISDGIETCDEDPCALVRAWREQQVQVRVHVVGLGLEDKERLAMQCISEAAGTAYHDALSAEELADGLQDIRATAAASEPGTETTWRVLDIVATNEAGEAVRVHGTAHWPDAEPQRVSSNGHNPMPAGEVQVTVGARTRNGNLYRPVTRSAVVAPSGATRLEVVVPEPPSVQARFLQQGEETGGSLIRAYQEGNEVFTFRPKDRAYVDPGSYEFRSEVNADNALSVNESFADGEHKDIVFQVVQTVRAHIKMVAADSGTDFRSNYELWQDGELRYKVHWSNGVRALPGTYDLHLPLRLTPHVHPGLVLSAEPEQDFRIEVPVGHVTVRYQDSAGQPMEDKRCFLERRNEEQRWVRDRISQTGQRIPLVPGTYRVQGWKQLGTFETQTFEIEVGEEREVVLRDQGGD